MQDLHHQQKVFEMVEGLNELTALRFALWRLRHRIQSLRV